MLESLLCFATLCAPQSAARPQPDSRPATRATTNPASRPSSRPRFERGLPADWGEDAPGQQVVPIKFKPISDAKYGTPEDVADRVDATDLIVGLVVGGQAFAYPINMLGGPQREIINEEFGGVPFCVNW